MRGTIAAGRGDNIRERIRRSFRKPVMSVTVDTLPTPTERQREDMEIKTVGIDQARSCLSPPHRVASALYFSRLAQCSLTLRPAHSPGRPRGPLHQRFQPLRYFHDCSDCFPLKRPLPGGSFSHWESALFARRTSNSYSGFGAESVSSKAGAGRCPRAAGRPSASGSEARWVGRGVGEAV